MSRTRTATRSASKTRDDATAESAAADLERYRSSRDSQAEVSATDDIGWTITLGDPESESVIEAVGPPAPAFPFPPVRWSGIYRHSPFVWPLPPLPTVSADAVTAAGNGHQPGASGIGPTPTVATPPSGEPATEAGFLFRTEELRVDVDGLFPTMTVSGTVSGLFTGRLTWIARVTRQPDGSYAGPITYRDGITALRPQANVSVFLHGLPIGPPSLHLAEARFSGGPAPDVVVWYRFAQANFRDVAFEYDTVSDATSVTTYNPTSHPNHPPSVPNTTLSLESAYARLGIRVTKTGGDSVVPIAEAGANTTWSDQEMHDAMEAHWSRWMDAPQWAVWVLFARMHDMGPSLGGIMFDDIGPAQRQGCAIFSGSFISQAPAGEANPGPWVQRMRFWTAAHEIGHTFNLAHSWQESLGTPWIPLQDEPDALSYMNYPFRYPLGGTDAFFSQFEFTFSPNELLFLRHAPERFVEQGAELWFVNHGFEDDAFEQVRKNSSGPLELAARVHRAPRYEFLEPVVMELRLKNTSSTACTIDANALAGNGVAIVVQKEGAPPRRWLPFKGICAAPQPKVLQPGEAIYAPVFLSASTSGWLVSDPGTYRIYAAAQAGGSMALSRPLQITVDRPASSEAEQLAGDVFTRQVAHTLAFGGSRVLTGANDTLREVIERLPSSRLATHARAALGAPMAEAGKVLVLAPSGEGETIALHSARPQEASTLLGESLGDFSAAADSLGHIGVTSYARKLATALGEEGNTEAQQAFVSNAADTLASRGVLPEVVHDLQQSASSD